MSTPYPVHDDPQMNLQLVWDFGGGTIVASGSDPDAEPVESTKLTEDQVVAAAADLIGPMFYYSPDRENEILNKFMDRLRERGFVS